MSNVAAAVRARLLNVAKAQGSDFQQVLLGCSLTAQNHVRTGACLKLDSR